MTLLQPVSPKNPNYPGFRPRKKSLEVLAIFLRVEITLPVCFLLTLSCATLNAQTTALNAQDFRPRLTQTSGRTSANANQPDSGTTQENLQSSESSSPSKEGVSAIQTPPPPCDGNVVDSSKSLEKKPSELPVNMKQETFPSQPNTPQTQTDSAVENPPCSGFMAIPRKEEPMPIQKTPVVKPGDPIPCGGKPMANPQVPIVQPVEPVPCPGKIAAPRQDTTSQIGNPTTPYADLSLNDAIANPGGFLGMRVRLQGFFGSYSDANQTGSFLSTDIPPKNVTKPMGLPILNCTVKLENGTHCTVEGTLVKIVSPASRKPFFALQVENTRTR
ncbi:MAG: hypothetical protein HQM08_06580 [Candidatus Riflebacteria bacterium]|nr:hypothetical protein [Candidatus Riflebacteria bacterium]